MPGRHVWTGNKPNAIPLAILNGKLNVFLKDTYSKVRGVKLARSSLYAQERELTGD
jgi:hypothetical protein